MAKMQAIEIDKRVTEMRMLSEKKKQEARLPALDIP